MNYLIALLLVWMRIFLGYTNGAPVVSSVHVRFISGNQATQYGHGSLADGTSLHYNTVDIGTREHQIQRRSAPTLQPLNALTSPLTSTQPITETSQAIHTKGAVEGPLEKRLLKAIDPLEILEKDETKGHRKGAAIKRSPLTRQFGFFNDFDYQHGGNNFRQRSPFRRPRTQKLVNAESLSPEGLFLPPIPTADTNHLEDTYAADAESAKYAAQHPPYFHEFPHKRAILYLNEEREDNGLEPNILRSIRPFFPFYEVNK